MIIKISSMNDVHLILDAIKAKIEGDLGLTLLSSDIRTLAESAIGLYYLQHIGIHSTEKEDFAVFASTEKMAQRIQQGVNDLEDGPAILIALDEYLTEALAALKFEAFDVRHSEGAVQLSSVAEKSGFMSAVPDIVEAFQDFALKFEDEDRSVDLEYFSKDTTNPIRIVIREKIKELKSTPEVQITDIKITASMQAIKVHDGESDPVYLTDWVYLLEGDDQYQFESNPYDKSASMTMNGLSIEAAGLEDYENQVEELMSDIEEVVQGYSGILFA